MSERKEAVHSGNHLITARRQRRQMSLVAMFDDDVSARDSVKSLPSTGSSSRDACIPFPVDVT